MMVMNEAIIKMINNGNDGIITIVNDDYYFDGYIAKPIKCQCGGNIGLYTDGWNKYLFNDNTKMFDLHIDGEDNDSEYICQECDKRLSELLPDVNTQEWN